MSKKHKIGGFKTQIWKACDDSNLRPAMKHAYVKDGFIYATNGHIAIRQSLSAVHEIPAEQIAFMEGKFFSVPLLKLLEKFDTITFTAKGIEANTNGDHFGAIFDYSECSGVFPNVDAVIPPTKERKTLDRIGINPKLLSTLTSTMWSGCGEFAIEFYGAEKAIVVTSNDIPRQEQLGILMPVILHDQQ